ncbi:MAG TPA: hypothetical protein VGI19_04800 [Candidatus Cybelea sp.]|jgi:hypothetical protein
MSVVPGGPLAPFSSLSPVTFTQGESFSRPRAFVKLDNVLYPITRYEISKNAHGATNVAQFTTGYNNLPDWTDQLFRGVEARNQNSPVYAEIWAGFPSNPGSEPSLEGLSRRFYGVLDVYDPEDMRSTTFHLRSIASPLTTDRITSAIQNLTTVQFLQKVCAPYKIPVVVDPSLSQPFTLAKVYANEFLVGLKNLIIWDVGLKSSIFDDVDIWEDNGTLYYVHPWNVTSVMQSQPQSKTGAKNYAPLTLEYGRDVFQFKPSHSPQFSRNIKVQIHTYSAKERLSVVNRVQSVVAGVEVSQIIKYSTATPDWGTNGGTSTVYNSDGNISQSKWTSSGGASTGSNAPISESGHEQYDEFVPNLTPTEVQSLAMALWRQISQHEYQADFEIPVTPENLPFSNIENRYVVDGYGMSKFNTTYWPRTLDETFDMATEPGSSEAQGWRVSVHAVNHTPPLGAT